MALQATASGNDLSGRLKQANQLNSELQRRIDELSQELQTALAENQRLAAELTRTRVIVKDLEDKIDALARENKQLSGQSVTTSKRARLKVLSHWIQIQPHTVPHLV